LTKKTPLNLWDDYHYDDARAEYEFIDVIKPIESNSTSKAKYIRHVQNSNFKDMFISPQNIEINKNWGACLVHIGVDFNNFQDDKVKEFTRQMLLAIEFELVYQ